MGTHIKEAETAHCHNQHLGPQIDARLRNLDSVMFNEFYLKAMIQRAENLVLYSGICSKAEFIMIFLLPKLTGNRTSQKIEKNEWTASWLSLDHSVKF